MMKQSLKLVHICHSYHKKVALISQDTVLFLCIFCSHFTDLCRMSSCLAKSINWLTSMYTPKLWLKTFMAGQLALAGRLKCTSTAGYSLRYIYGWLAGLKRLKCLYNFSLSESFFFLRILSSENTKFGVQIFHFWKVTGKINILSNHIFSA